MNSDNAISALSLSDFFEEKVRELPDCAETTKSYIIQLLSNPNDVHNDVAGQSVTLLYAEANIEYNFKLFQTIGDFLLFANGIFPKSLQGASKEYYNNIAQQSYYTCHLLLKKQWPLFKELSHNFLKVTDYLQCKVKTQQYDPIPF